MFRSTWNVALQQGDVAAAARGNLELSTYLRSIANPVPEFSISQPASFGDPSTSKVFNGPIAGNVR
jgi:hypothetical protein